MLNPVRSAAASAAAVCCITTDQHSQAAGRTDLPYGAPWPDGL